MFTNENSELTLMKLARKVAKIIAHSQNICPDDYCSVLSPTRRATPPAFTSFDSWNSERIQSGGANEKPVL